MGSSNGVTRGQLRPYFSGRTPPFILVGTLIILIIFGFSYWSLNSQYGDLQIEAHEFQEQLHTASLKRIELEKQSRTLQDQLDTIEKTSTNCMNSLKRREEKLTELAEQARDVLKVQSQLESTNNKLESCQKEKTVIDGECKTVKELSKQMEAERDQFQKKVTHLEKEIKQLKEQLKKNKSTTAAVANPAEDKLKEKHAEEQSPTISNNNVLADENQQAAAENADVSMPPVSDAANAISQEEGYKDPNSKLQQDPAELNTIPANEHAEGLNGTLK